jgi:hypothetical protein
MTGLVLAASKPQHKQERHNVLIQTSAREVLGPLPPVHVLLAGLIGSAAGDG